MSITILSEKEWKLFIKAYYAFKLPEIIFVGWL